LDIKTFGLSDIPLVELKAALRYVLWPTQGPLESKSSSKVSRVNSFSTCFVRRQAGGEIESDDSDEYQTPSERGDIYKFGYSEIPLVDFKAALPLSAFA
jgi:hypothetical protein